MDFGAYKFFSKIVKTMKKNECEVFERSYGYSSSRKTVFDFKFLTVIASKDYDGDFERFEIQTGDITIKSKDIPIFYKLKIFSLLRDKVKQDFKKKRMESLLNMEKKMNALIQEEKAS